MTYGLSAIGKLYIALSLKAAGSKFRVSKKEENKGFGSAEHGKKSYI